MSRAALLFLRVNGYTVAAMNIKSLFKRLFTRHHVAAPIDEGHGQPVVLIHGMASSNRMWGHVLPTIKSNARIVAVDLLGFGDSPKPKDSEYTVQDHAEAIIRTLHRKGIWHNAIIVAHSMGALIAVEIAKQKPHLVQELILCGMPLYRFDSKKRLLPRQESFYLSLYEKFLTVDGYALKTAERIKKMKPNMLGFGLNKQTEYAALKSLENVIMNQTTYDDVQSLKQPVHLIIGRFDVLAIRRHLLSLAKANSHITVQQLNEQHEVTERASRYIAEVIDAAVEKRAINPDILREMSRLPNISIPKMGKFVVRLPKVGKNKHILKDTE